MKQAIITGAAGGPGVSLVQKYPDEGYYVHAFVRKTKNEPDEIRKNNPEKMNVYIADAGNTQSVAEAVAMVAEKTDHIDVIVSNAAVLPRDHLMPTSVSADNIYRLAERERVKDKGNLFFNCNGEVFPY